MIIYVNVKGEPVPPGNVIVNEKTGEFFDAETGEPLTIKEQGDKSYNNTNNVSGYVSNVLIENIKPNLPKPEPLNIELLKNIDIIKEEEAKDNNTVFPPPSPTPLVVSVPISEPIQEFLEREEKEIPVLPKPEPLNIEIVSNLNSNKKGEGDKKEYEGLPLPEKNIAGKTLLLNEEGINDKASEDADDYDETSEYKEDNEEFEIFPSLTDIEYGDSNTADSNLKDKIRKSTWEAGGRPSENKAKIPEIINIENWTDDTSSDPHIGLGSENDVNSKENKPKVNKKVVLNERDYIMMSFMTRYRYCYSDQLSRLVGAENKDVRARLSKLEKEGFIRREVITRGQDLWLTRKAGLQMIGSPYSAINKGQVSTLYIQHTIGVGNLGVELEMLGEGKNILGEPDFPKMNRYPYGIYNPDEAPSLTGEMTVTEREIRSSNRVLKGGNSETTLDLKNKVEAAVLNHSAPERLEGNEWMFVVYGKGEHFPDLVIHRGRSPEGKPQHIAVELELTAKDLPSWRRILKWYRDYGIMYGKVYYFTHNRTIATRLHKVIEELNMEDFVVVRKYVPANNRGPFWG